MEKSNKKILHFISIFIIIIFIPNILNSNLEEVRMSLKEICYSYYMRGKNIQSNIAKDHFFSPEEATEQNINYLVTTSFTTSIYEELLGIVIPISPTDLIDYSNKNLGSPEVFIYAKENENYDLEMKIYDPSQFDNYKIIPNPTLNDILGFLQIGDILLNSGVAIVIYDLIKDDEGRTIDAKILESGTGNGRGYINTKIDRNYIPLSETTTFSSPGFSLFLNNKLNSNIDEGLIEGSIGLKKISNIYGWAHIDNKQLRGRQFFVFRFLNEDSSGNAVLNFKGYYEYIKSNYSDNNIIELSDKNKDRIKFKHLYIEKTVDKNNNNIVELEESLTYKIIIRNNGEDDYNEELIVTENLSKFVTYKTKKENKKIKNFKTEQNNKKLIWNLGKLKKKDEFIIEYTVKVSNGKANDIIESKGFVANITSSTITNVIGNNLKKNQMDLLSKNYDQLKNKFNGKKLINEIYKKAFNVDIEFDKFNIKDLIINNDLQNRRALSISLNETNSFYKATLNHYWSSLASINYKFFEDGEEVTIYNLKEFQYFLDIEKSERREDFIYKETLKPGDILIYTNYNDTQYKKVNDQLEKINVTNEEGEYYYIYIEKRGFVGVNYGNDGIPNTIDDRNEFNSKYYINNNLSLYLDATENVSDEFLEIANLQTLFGKDYYVILRPSLCFEFPFVEENKKSGKKTGLIVFLIILSLLILLVVLYILLKFIKLKKEGKEFSLKNLKEQPLLGN